MVQQMQWMQQLQQCSSATDPVYYWNMQVIYIQYTCMVQQMQRMQQLQQCSSATDPVLLEHASNTSCMVQQVQRMQQVQQCSMHAV